MEYTYSLYYDNRCIAENYTEEEFKQLLEDIELESESTNIVGQGSIKFIGILKK